ncbi:hypothetical protein WKW50_16320 [Ochrobactrum sp. GPK 3]
MKRASLTLLAAAALAADMRVPIFHIDDTSRTPRGPKLKPTPYRAPEPDHQAHRERAEAKRKRKAEKLKRIAGEA